MCLVDIAQLVRAPDCGSGGRRFESDYPPHFFYIQIGVSSSGKTTDFDSVIRRFESCYPCQNHKHNFCCVCDFLNVGRMRTVGSATQATYRDRYVALPKSRVRQIVLGTARSGQNNVDTEYPATPAN